MANQDTLEIPTIAFATDGELIITASPTSSKRDFDFYEGKWTEFESTQEMYRVLNGIGNIDNYLATFDGVPFEGMSVRLFNTKTRLWSIYWADSIEGKLDPPVVGSFENNVAHFFTRNILNDKKILIVFRWDVRDKENPVWSQAFSADNGKTWEWNWYMYFTRL
jgi:hypothetical protein